MYDPGSSRRSSCLCCLCLYGKLKYSHYYCLLYTSAVGISLFDSIFIAMPAAAGYLYHVSSNKEIFFILPVILIAHGIGVIFGSKNATKIDQKMLKRIVAVASIVIAGIKLLL